jgi:hypothetical protein
MKMSVYTLNIVGESYRQKEIKLCHEGERLILKREPENKYDRNAIAVLRENGGQIGYLSRDDAEWVARIMDNGDRVEAKIKWITGGKRDKPSYGVVIDVNTTPNLGWEENRERQKVSSMDGKEERAGGKKSSKGFWKRIFGG